MKIIQSAMMPTSTHCRDVVNSVVVKQSCRSLELAFTRVVMDDEMWKNLKDSQRRLWGTEPKALAKENDMEVSFVLLRCLDLVPDHTTVVCSKQPENPGMPAFCRDELLYLFFSR